MSERKTWLYIFAKHEDEGCIPPIKIGISNNPWARLSTLQTACPFKVTCYMLFGPFTRDEARWHEKGLHEAYAEHQAFGEWFNVSASEVFQLLYDELGKRVAGFESMSEPERLIALRTLA
jgi:hypothetical protein